jgi:hypothetical protein
MGNSGGIANETSGMGGRRADLGLRRPPVRSQNRITQQNQQDVDKRVTVLGHD